jgi:adenylate kinase
MRYKSILLFGAPGSGKGTQGKILSSIPGFFHVSTGDIFRSINLQSEIGRVFLEYSSRGELVPDEPTINLWRDFIHNCEKANQFHPDHDTLVLDGIPRNPHQAEMLRDTLEVVSIFYLRCRKVENLVKRLQRRALKENRLDDANIDVIKNRLETYERETKPVLEFYGKDLVQEIDADQKPHKVLFDILTPVVKV